LSCASNFGFNTFHLSSLQILVRLRTPAVSPDSYSLFDWQQVKRLPKFIPFFNRTPSSNVHMRIGMIPLSSTLTIPDANRQFFSFRPTIQFSLLLGMKIPSNPSFKSTWPRIMYSPAFANFIVSKHCTCTPISTSMSF